MLGAPVALQALGDLIDAGADARVLHRRQHRPVTFTGNDGAQDLLSGLANHVGDDVGKLDVHLGECLLHVLHMPTLARQQHPALPPQRAQRAHRVGRPERATEQAVGHQLLQPLAVQHIGLAARDILDVPRVDQQHREAARLQELEQRYPVHAGRFHRYGIDAAAIEPVG